MVIRSLGRQGVNVFGEDIVGQFTALQHGLCDQGRGQGCLPGRSAAGFKFQYKTNEQKSCNRTRSFPERAVCLVSRHAPAIAPGEK